MICLGDSILHFTAWNSCWLRGHLTKVHLLTLGLLHIDQLRWQLTVSTRWQQPSNCNEKFVWPRAAQWVEMKAITQVYDSIPKTSSYFWSVTNCLAPWLATCKSKTSKDTLLWGHKPGQQIVSADQTVWVICVCASHNGCSLIRPTSTELLMEPSVAQIAVTGTWIWKLVINGNISSIADWAP